MATLTQFLIICPLVFLAAFVDAIGGGGGLISLPAYLMAGIPVHAAIGTNKLSACMGTAMATGKLAKNGCIPWRLAAFCVPCALGGSVLGARLALVLSDAVFSRVMLVILPLTAVYVLWGSALRGKAPKPPLAEGPTRALAMLFAFAIGIYDGFYGPGTGTFLILLLSGAARLPLTQSNGLAKAINLSTNVAALTVFFFGGTLLLQLGLTAGCFSLAGGWLGARFFLKNGPRSVRPIILLVLALFFAKVLWQMFF